MELYLSTLDYYNQNAKEYFNKTINADMSEAYEKFVKYLPTEGKILDVGSGSGRDTLAFQVMGYEVEALDGSEEMCKTTEMLTGIKVRCICFDEIDYDSEFDGIWACASLLHVSKAKTNDVLVKIKDSLVDGGIFYASYKYGNDELEIDSKYYNNYTEAKLKELMEVIGFQTLEIWSSSDKLKREDRWINIICRKK